MLDLALGRAPTLGAGRLVCVDGPAGSGKTTLAGDLLAACDGARVVHLDDLYLGWTGLPRAPGQIRALLGPLAQGHPGTYRRHDWAAGRPGPSVRVPPSGVLVLEGVGAGSAPPELITALVWVEAPAEERLRRGLARDGAEAEPHWRRWMVEEQEHFTAYRTRERADLVVDGAAPTVQVVDQRRPRVSAPAETGIRLQ